MRPSSRFLTVLGAVRARDVPGALGALTVAAIVATVTLGVIARYVLKISIIWTDEFARFALAWLTFLGAASAVARREQIRVDILITFMPRRWRFVMHWIAALGGLVAMGIIFATSSELLFGPPGRTLSPAMQVPYFWVYLSLPVGCLFMTAFLLHDVWNLARRHISPEHRIEVDEQLGL